MCSIDLNFLIRRGAEYRGGGGGGGGGGSRVKMLDNGKIFLFLFFLIKHACAIHIIQIDLSKVVDNSTLQKSGCN